MQQNKIVKNIQASKPISNDCNMKNSLFRRMWKRNYQSRGERISEYGSFTEKLNAGMEFTGRCYQSKTRSGRRNAVCELDLIERSGTYCLLKHYVRLKRLADWPSISGDVRRYHVGTTSTKWFLQENQYMRI